MAYSFDPKDDVEAQWQKWQEQTPLPTLDFTEDGLREQIINDLKYVSQMDVKEYTLYQKWCEVQDKYPAVIVNDLWEGEQRVLADEGQRRAIEEIKSNFGCLKHLKIIWHYNQRCCIPIKRKTCLSYGIVFVPFHLQ